ncbi:hypothetical protein A6R68_06740, partial [Neotoma lepida]
MYHGMNPSNGDGFLEQQLQQQQPQSPQRLLAVILWFQLALCFGPAQLTGGRGTWRAAHGHVETLLNPNSLSLVLPVTFSLKPWSTGQTSAMTLKSYGSWEAHLEEERDGRNVMAIAFLYLISTDPIQALNPVAPRPLDTPLNCRIPQIEDAEIHNKTYRHGDKLIITCHEGFKIRYPDLYNMVSLCRDDGTWNNLPICQGCLRPLASSNGYVNISEFQTSFPVGTVIAYRCFPGFKLEGSEYLECLHNLIWSSSPPRDMLEGGLSMLLAFAAASQQYQVSLATAVPGILGYSSTRYPWLQQYQ